VDGRWPPANCLEHDDLSLPSHRPPFVRGTLSQCPETLSVKVNADRGHVSPPKNAMGESMPDGQWTIKGTKIKRDKNSEEG
jgi:hypothetical protein